GECPAESIRPAERELGREARPDALVELPASCPAAPWTGLPITGSAAALAIFSRAVIAGTSRDTHLKRIQKSGPPPGGGGPQHVECRRRPTLPHPNECSTIGAGGLSFRVRNGTGRSPSAITTDNTIKLPTHQPAGNPKVVCSGSHSGCEQHVVNKPSAY